MLCTAEEMPTVCKVVLILKICLQRNVMVHKFKLGSLFLSGVKEENRLSS